MLLGFVFIPISIIVQTLMASESYILFYTIWLTGPMLIFTSIYTIQFAFLGGINQVVSQKLWGTETEQNASSGLRDGVLLSLLLNIPYLPLSLATTTSIFQWGRHLDAGEIFLILLISFPILFVIFGIIGEKVSSFFYQNYKPELPPDYDTKSHTCPHCGARYYYGENSVDEKKIICQNCNKQFTIE